MQRGRVEESEGSQISRGEGLGRGFRDLATQGYHGKVSMASETSANGLHGQAEVKQFGETNVLGLDMGRQFSHTRCVARLRLVLEVYRKPLLE